MEISTILTADVLDIIFEGRNKEYGAYELRRSYKRRLVLSIAVMLLVILLLFIGFAFAGKKTELVTDIFIPPDPTLQSVKPIEKVIPPPTVKPPAPPPQHIQTRQYARFQIVKEDVKPDEKPPEIKELDDARIGLKNDNGVINNDIIAPSADEGVTKGIIETPKKEDDDANAPWVKVEIESEYPGGLAAWTRFLHKTLRYPQEAIDNEIQGSVLVQFIVDKEGNVSDVEALSGPPELRAEAIRVIRKSGKWTPAIQNGRPVKSYKKQPIGFRLESN